MMKKLNFKNIFQFVFATSLLIVGVSCTNLDPSYDDSVLVETTEGTFGGVNATTFLQSAYNDIYAMAEQTNTYALEEVTTDELVVLTRGADWSDNGVWRLLHTHSWNPSHTYVLNTWNERNSAIFRTNQIIAPESNATASELAQAKLLRAFNMFYVMDLYGQVPFRGVNEGVDVDPSVFSRSEAFEFIVNDINEAMPGLTNGDPGDIFTVNKAFANFLLAKLYINKDIYTGSADASDYTKVVEAIDAITGDGYELDADYFGIFITENFGSNSEIILALDRGHSNRVWNILHPNQGGWNGFATLGEVYDSFESSDIRLGEPNLNGIGTGMLIGQQYQPNGDMFLDRQGNPMIFTKDFPNGISGNNENTGVRPMKYTRSAAGAPDPGNGVVMARYSDALLMKAEAIMKGGASTVTGESIIDGLRTLRGASANGSYTMAELLDERRRELYIEGWRRNDQVRFGTFSSTWDMKDNTETFRVLFPIPASAVATNPNLTQNEGY